VNEAIVPAPVVWFSAAAKIWLGAPAPRFGSSAEFARNGDADRSRISG
jgi:hypothetical protein